MRQSEDIKFAIDLKNNNEEIKAPINDIINCIQDLRQTGVSNKQIEKMIPNIFISNNSYSYQNHERHPECDEILIYDLPDDWLDMMNDSE